MHHLDGAACETKGHGPKGALTRPVGYLIQCSAIIRVSSSGSPRQIRRRQDIYISRKKRGSTYSAYCIAPFLPSWLGNGTSRRACFIGGGVPGFPGTIAGDAALSEELEERKAVLPARNGNSAVAGLAVRNVSYEP